MNTRDEELTVLVADSVEQELLREAESAPGYRRLSPRLRVEVRRQIREKARTLADSVDIDLEGFQRYLESAQQWLVAQRSRIDQMPLAAQLRMLQEGPLGWVRAAAAAAARPEDKPEVSVFEAFGRPHDSDDQG
ncbi:MAG TPA: hypothetical protein PLP01_10230 [Phycisphaerae bacterium]|nr:hypothetical protein [Phycisphaerae bacterium]